MVRRPARCRGYRPMPILFNEDDHFDFDKPANNFIAAVGGVRLVGLLRLPDEGRRLRRRLPERAGELGDQQRAEARLLPLARGNHRQQVAPRQPMRASQHLLTVVAAVLAASALAAVAIGPNAQTTGRGAIQTPAADEVLAPHPTPATRRMRTPTCRRSRRSFR